MRAVKILLALGLLLLVGCVNKESAKADKTLEQDSLQQVQQQLVSLKNQLQTERVKYQKQIKELKEENIEIQNVAMKTIMTMLKKQIAYDKKIQDRLESKIVKLRNDNKALQTKVQQIQG